VVALSLSLATGLGVLAWLLRGPAAALPGTGRPLQTALDAHGLRLAGAEGFAISRFEPRKQGAALVLEAERDQEILRLELLRDPGEPGYRGWLQDQRAVLDGQFTDRQAPYPGQLSTTLRCPEAFQPSQRQAGESWLYQLFANERLAYGGCSRDLLRYRAALLLRPCPQRDLGVKLELFTPLETPDQAHLDSITTLRCD
jgi:hypothetical protein